MMMSSEARTVELFRRNTDGPWEGTPYAEDDEIALTGMRVTVSASDIYKDIVLKAEI